MSAGVAIGTVADQHLDEVRRISGEPIAPVVVLELEDRLPAALERQGDGDARPLCHGDRRRAVEIVDEDAETTDRRRCPPFGGDVAERLGDERLGGGEPLAVSLADGSVDPEQSLERLPVVDGQQEQLVGPVHDSAAAALSTDASSWISALRAAAIAAGRSCWKMLRPNTTPAAPQSSR